MRKYTYPEFIASRTLACMRVTPRLTRPLVGCAAVVALTGGAVMMAGAVSATATPTTAHGTYFLFKSAIDNNFCVDVAPGATAGRAVSLSACGTADTERWTLTDNADGTNLVVDSQGMCLDKAGRVVGDGTPLEVFACGFQSHQRFRYTADGLIQDKTTKDCLSVPLAATGAAVSLATCDNTVSGQIFKLAR